MLNANDRQRDSARPRPIDPRDVRVGQIAAVAVMVAAVFIAMASYAAWQASRVAPQSLATDAPMSAADQARVFPGP